MLFIESGKQKASLHQLAPRISERISNQLVEKLNSRSISIAQKTGLPLIKHEKRSQIDFAEELIAAFENAFNLGYDRVIAIGNDCPELSSRDLGNAEQELLRNDYVLGPALDGGTYLIGLTRETFAKLKLDKISWQSDEVFAQLKNQLEACNFCGECFEVKRDLDTLQDFQYAFRSRLVFFKRFKSLLYSYISGAFEQVQTDFSAALFLFYSWRAPPIIIESHY